VFNLQFKKNDPSVVQALPARPKSGWNGVGTDLSPKPGLKYWPLS
jgi:hypothetical protein